MRINIRGSGKDEIMAIFYVLGGDDIVIVSTHAKRLNALSVTKEEILDDTIIGRKYHDKGIYVVDDTPFMREAIKDRLVEEAQQAGTPNPCVHAYDPLAALKNFPSERPDVVIVDWNMQRAYGFNGDELIRRMREIEKGF